MHTIQQAVDSEYIDEFVFDTDESVPEFIVDSFTAWLTHYVGEGANFSDGQSLQYGYTVLRCKVQSRQLRLLAPDFRSMPINWISDLGRAFKTVALHKYTPETFGFTPDIPTLQQTAIVGQKFDTIPMFANRLQPVENNPNDSGWFFGSGSEDVDNEDPDQLSILSLYEATLAAPHVLQFLSMPVGCQIVFDGGNPVVLQDYEELPIPKGSYLDQMFNR